MFNCSSRLSCAVLHNKLLSIPPDKNAAIGTLDINFLLIESLNSFPNFSIASFSSNISFS